MAVACIVQRGPLAAVSDPEKLPADLCTVSRGRKCVPTFQLDGVEACGQRGVPICQR